MDSIEQLKQELQNALQGKVFGSSIENTTIALALALTTLQEEQFQRDISLEAFLEKCSLSDGVKEILARNLSNVWDVVCTLMGAYPSSDLRALVLHDIEFTPKDMRGENVTPKSVAELACKVLNLQDGENVLDITCGMGNFLTLAHDAHRKNHYTGIENALECIDVAMLRAALLGEDAAFCFENAFTYTPVEKFDKAFSSGPFMMKSKELEEYRTALCASEQYDIEKLNRISSDWAFAIKMMECLKDSGKAVAVMTNGSLFNHFDSYVRKYFLERGEIEAVISLPVKMFQFTVISVSLVVFSHGNTTVRLVDAEDICTPQGRIHCFTEENLAEILERLAHTGEKSVDVDLQELGENDYSLYGPAYLQKPVVADAAPFKNVIVKISRGGQFKTDAFLEYHSDVETDVQYLMLSNLGDGTIDFIEDGQYLTEVPKRMQKFVLPNHALVISKLATPTFRSAVVEVQEGHSIIAGSNLFIVEVDETKVNPYFLQAFFENPIGVDTLNRAANGTTLRTLSVESISNMQIPLPDLATQNAIAEKYQDVSQKYIATKLKMHRLQLKKQKIFNA